MTLPRPTDQELRGMTVNERLFVCGLLDKWDDAKIRRNKDEMTSLLRSVTMNEVEAAWTTDSVLKRSQT